MVSNQGLVLCAGGATIICSGGSEITFSTGKLKYTGSNLHSVTILHFYSSVFFSRKFLSFYAGPLALLTVSGCRTSSHCLKLVTLVGLISFINLAPFEQSDWSECYNHGRSECNV